MPLERTKWAKPPRHAAYQAIYSVECTDGYLTDASNKRIHDLLMASKKKKKCLRFTFPIHIFPCKSEPLAVQFFLHASKLFEPFEGLVSIATRAGYVCVCVQLVAFCDAHKRRSVPQASEDGSTVVNLSEDFKLQCYFAHTPH